MWSNLIQEGDLRRKRNMHNRDTVDRVLANITGKRNCDNCGNISSCGRFCSRECFEEYEEGIKNV